VSNSTTAAANPPAAAANNGLKQGILSPLETFGQSVANIAPTATPTVVIPLVFIVAGAGAWAAYAFALLAIGTVALNINQFARRSSSPGNIYTYIALGLGPTAAIFVGWALFVGYTAIASSVTTGFTNYVNVLIRDVFGLHSDLPPIALVGILAVSVIGSWLVAYKDVRLSARLMLAFELASVSLILFVIGVTLVRYGFRIDFDQLTLKGVDFGGLRLGLVLAIFSFTGFESATSLGSEAKNPLKTIPHAVLRSAIFVGFLFIIASYASVIGFAGHDTTLATTAAPIQDLATFGGFGFLSIPITIGAIISFFACVLASITAGARVLFQLGRHGLFHTSFGEAHQSNETPHVAVTLAAVLAFIPAALLTLNGSNLFAIYGWIGTTATLALIVAYAAVSIAAPVYLHRLGELKPWHVGFAVFAVAFQAFAFAGTTIWPVPTDPGVIGAIIAFVVLLVGGFALGAFQYLRSQTVRDGIDADLAGINARYQVGADAA
jgi:amino acid transporter